MNAQSEPIPSWQVTEAMLTEWGFPVRKTDKCVGSKIVVSEGMTWSAAKHAAWAAGFTRIESMPDHVRAEIRAEKAAERVEQHRICLETIAFLREHNMIVSGRGNAAINA